MICRSQQTQLTAGQHTKAISKRFNCSQGAIEQILSQHPELVSLRQEMRREKKRQQMKDSLTDTIDRLAQPTRSEVKAANNRAYMWLFKNDKKWLFAHLPPSNGIKVPKQ